MDAKVFGTALAVEREFRFSWWDSLILASALRAGCAYLLSEDMHHRQTVGSLRVIDPFREEPSALFPNR